jgi:hypothetical protein
MYDALHAAAGPELRAWMDAHHAAVERADRYREALDNAADSIYANVADTLKTDPAYFSSPEEAVRAHNGIAEELWGERLDRADRALYPFSQAWPFIYALALEAVPYAFENMRLGMRAAAPIPAPPQNALTGDRVRVFLSNFYALRPALARFASVVPVKEKTHASQSRHPDASNEIVSGKDTIVLYPKFWTHDHDVQAFIFAHELGHWALSGPYGYTTARFIPLAAHAGIDVWDTASLPFAAGNMEEAFADAFASYYTDKDVFRRYPKWARLVETVAASGAGVPISVG